MVAAKYYLYINKLAHKDLSLDEFMAKINWRYDFKKLPPSIIVIVRIKPQAAQT